MIMHKTENARTLASLLGVGEEEAAQLLEVSILISVSVEDTAAVSCADFFEKIIARTADNVTRNLATHAAGVEVVFGTVQPRTPRFLRVAISSTHIKVGRMALSEPISACHDLILLLAACYTIGHCLKEALPHELSVGGSPADCLLVISIDEVFGRDREWLNRPVLLEDSYLAGAGAVGNGFSYALTLLGATGRLNIADPDFASAGNLNRCVYFDQASVGSSKAEILAAKVRTRLPQLEVMAHKKVLSDCKSEDDPRWLKTLIVAVDSRKARRNLQAEVPREVFDASTTGVTEVVLHHHRQPSGDACLGCIYENTPDESARQKHVAESLGVTLEAVQSLFVDQQAAKNICALYPNLSVQDVVGKAYDSLFKELCSQAALRTPSQQQVFAPFAFVSVIAGIYLLIEVARRRAGDIAMADYNYWRISPWAAPVQELKQKRPSSPNCESCGCPVMQKVRTALWGKESSPS